MTNKNKQNQKTKEFTVSKSTQNDRVWSVLQKLVFAEVIIGIALIVALVASYIKEVI